MSVKRIFIGGLSETVTDTELEQRFSHFGKVSNVSLKTRVDNDGNVVKSFAHLDLLGDDNSIKKCFSTYQNAKWKGSVLKLQFAKESFIERLEKEREDVIQEASQETKPEPATKVEIVTSARGVPGTLVPGKQDWVVAKYGRAVPIMRLKKSYKVPMVRLDPSKHCHAARVFKDESSDLITEQSCDKLTWEIDQPDSEITKKRKGEFLDRKPTAKKKSMKSDTVVDKSSKITKTSHNGCNLTATTTVSGNGFTGGDIDSPFKEFEVVRRGVGTKAPSTKPQLVHNKFDSDVESDAESDNSSLRLSKKKQTLKHQTVRSKFDSDIDSDSESHSPSKKAGLSSIKNSKQKKDIVKKKTGDNRKSVVGSKSSDQNIDSKKTCAKSDKVINDNSSSPPYHSGSESDSNQLKANTPNNSPNKFESWKKVPEFKGLAMLKDFNLEDQEKPFSKSTQDESMLSSSSNDKTDTSQTELVSKKLSLKNPGSKKNVLTASKEVLTVKEKGLTPRSDESDMQIEVRKKGSTSNEEESDSSAGTDEILLQHKSQKQVHAANTSSQATSDMGTTEFDSGVATGTNLKDNSGIAADTVCGISSSVQMDVGSDGDGDSNDSDLDSNDFALVAKKLRRIEYNKKLKQGKVSATPTETKSTVGSLGEVAGGRESTKEKKGTSKDTFKMVDSDNRFNSDNEIEKMRDIKKDKNPVAESKQDQKEKMKTFASSKQLEDKHRIANQKRLEALKEQARQRDLHHKLMQEALKNVDSSKNNTKRIVFDSSDEENEPKIQDKTSKEMKTLNAAEDAEKPGPRLFDDSDDDSDDKDDDYDEMFKSKPEYEGRKGEKLLKMEKKYEDSRFKLDRKFADTDSEEEETVPMDTTQDNDNDGATLQKSLREEKSASLSVLEGIVGKSTLDRFSEKIRKNTKKIVDMNAIRFDPTKMSAPPEVEKKSKKKLSMPASSSVADTKPGSSDDAREGATEDKGVTESQEKTEKDEGSSTVDNRSLVLPAAKSHVEVASSLVDLFKTPADAAEDTAVGSFSLTQQFGDVDSDDIESDDEQSGMKGAVFKFKDPENTSLLKPQDKPTSIASSKTSDNKSAVKTKIDTASILDKESYFKTDFSSDDEDEDDIDDDEIKDPDNMVDTSYSMKTENGIDAAMINAGRVDVRMTKEEWSSQWDTLRQTIIKIYKRKHKDALKKKRINGEIKRKKEFLKNSRKPGKKNFSSSRKSFRDNR